MAALTQTAMFLIGCALTDATSIVQVPATSVRNKVLKVEVKGNKRIPTEQILQGIGTREGEPYNAEQLYDDVTRLVESRRFKSIRPEEKRTENGVIITFVVSEYPNVIDEVVILHARHIRRDNLEEFTPDVGAILDPTTNRNACFEIQHYLRTKGRYWANVVLEEGNKDSDKRVVFNITEGPIVRVRSVKFHCRHGMAPANFLRNFITTTSESDNDAGLFSESDIDMDVARLQWLFWTVGCSSAKVARELIFSDDGSRVDVTFHIDERPRHGTTLDAAKSKAGPYLMFVDLRKQRPMPTITPFDKLVNLPAAMAAARSTGDRDRLAALVGCLDEPLLRGGDLDQQNLHLQILASAACTSREPLVCLRAISALGRFKDPRAVTALAAAYHEHRYFFPQVNSLLKIHALTALAETRSTAALSLLKDVIRQGSVKHLVSTRNDLETDECLAGLRGLANFEEGDTAVTALFLADILEAESDFALRNRAHLSLKAITGLALPRDANTWRKELSARTMATSKLLREETNEWTRSDDFRPLFSRQQLQGR